MFQLKVFMQEEDQIEIEVHRFSGNETSAVQKRGKRRLNLFKSDYSALKGRHGNAYSE
jgi:hypothetical protein